MVVLTELSWPALAIIHTTREIYPASSLTLSLKNGAVLVPLISLPMQLPVLIFATGAVGQFAMGLNGYPILALLLAGSILAVIVTPFVIAFSLKLAWLS